MTTVAAPTALRPVAWHRLAWVVWRRYRTTLFAVWALLAVLAAYLLVTGHQMRSAYAAVQACTPVRSASCEFRWTSFHNAYGNPGLVGTALLLLPGMVGVFAGTPLFAKELETGTFRYAWTQGAGRMRWAIAMLVPAAVAFTGVMAAFGALVGWHDQPLVAAGIAYRLQPATFPAGGLAVAGWTLIGFALGVLLGMLWRRVLPALATSFAVWFGLAYVASDLRKHYETPLTTAKLQIGVRDMPTGQWWDKAGVRIPDAQINRVLESAGIQQQGQGNFVTQPGRGSIDPVHFLLQRGYTQITSYQPDHRYWPFQWIEFSWLTVFSIALLYAVLWLLRRRPA